MQNRITSLLALVLSAVIFAFGAVLVKILSADFSGSFLALVRFGGGFVLTFLALKILRRKIRVTNWKAWVGRGALGAFSMILYFVAIKQTNPGRAALLVNTYPAFVMVFGVLFFNDRFRFGSLFGLVFCLAGAVLVLNDGSSYPLIGDIIGLLSALSGALAVNYIGVLRRDHSTFIVYMAACTFGILGSCWSAGEIVNVTPRAVPALALLAAAMFVGQTLMTYSIKYTSPVTGSLFSYLTLPLIFILSAWILGEKFTTRFYWGAAIIAFGLIGKVVLEEGLDSWRSRTVPDSHADDDALR